MTVAPYVLAPVEVATVHRRSPSFVRIAFAGPALAEVAVDGPLYDQRIKLLVPPTSGTLPDLSAPDGDWYAAWLALPVARRGAMRTYTVRELSGVGEARRLTIDLVLHPGAAGPASTWAGRAGPGDPALLVAPRAGVASGGIEFAPGSASRLLLAADETAVPAVARILADLPRDAAGTALCEVPHPDDAELLAAPPGIEVRWLPRRDHADVGSALIPAVLAHLGGDATREDGSEPRPPHRATDVAVWETPDVTAAVADGTGVPGLYAWIAGESGVVTTLRRHLIRDLGVGRHQVAFMGYWRRGRSAAG